MQSSWQQTVVFFEGEDAEAIKTAFVETSARYPHRSAYEIAQYVFRELKDPALRAGKAAEIWANDIEVLERIRVLILKGPAVADASEAELLRRALQIADDADTPSKDRIAAIRLAGELQGLVKKAVEIKTASNDNPAEFWAALAAKLPN